MKKAVLAVLAAILIVTGCASGGQNANDNKGNEGNDAQATAGPTGQNASAGADAGKVKLKFMHWWAYVTDEVIDEFEKQNPDIEVENQYVAFGDAYFTKLQAQASINELPDVVGINPTVPALINQSKLLNLQDAMNTPAYDSEEAWQATLAESLMADLSSKFDNNPNLNEELKPKNGNVWAVPFGATSLAVIYNKSIFDQVGIQAPATWEQFMDNNDKLKAAGYIPIAHAGNVWRNWWIKSILDQTARDIDGDDYTNGGLQPDDPRIVEALAIFTDMVNRGHFDKGAVTAGIEDAQALFVQQKAAQFYIVPENFVTYLQDNVPADVELGAFVLPGAKGIPYRSIGGAANMVAVSADSKHQEAALKFAKFLTSAAIFNLLSDQHVVPSVKGYQPPAGDDIMGAYAQAYNEGFATNHTPPWTPESEKIWESELISGMLIGSLSPEETAKQMKELWEKDANNPANRQ